MTEVRVIDSRPRPFEAGPVTDAEAEALFRAAVRLFKLWGVSDEQAAILLDQPLRTFRRWKADGPGRIDRDSRARLSNLIGIHKALRLVFRDPSRGYDWVKASNASFHGRSALSVMLDGDLTDLMRVRRYLDAERGGW